MTSVLVVKGISPSDKLFLGNCIKLGRTRVLNCTVAQCYAWTDPHFYSVSLDLCSKETVAPFQSNGGKVAIPVWLCNSFLMRTDLYVCTSLCGEIIFPVGCLFVFKHINHISTLSSRKSAIKGYRLFHLRFLFEGITTTIATQTGAR